MHNLRRKQTEGEMRSCFLRERVTGEGGYQKVNAQRCKIFAQKKPPEKFRRNL